MAEPKTKYITRFAPSPTGLLHLGHAFSALFAYKRAQETEGKFILRIEDIDPERCHTKFEEAIFEDLHWLGLRWEEPVRRQSEHMAYYEQTLQKLDDQGLLYPCFCSRKDIRMEAKRSGYAPHSPEGILYPGTCKNLSNTKKTAYLEENKPYALRLDMQKAKRLLKLDEKPLYWEDLEKGRQIATPEIVGDVVLARKDIKSCYHLSVSLDDAVQNISLITRGEELFYASHLHRLLQALLDLPVPQWHHHKIITNENGERLAKRDKSISLRSLREEGYKPHDIMKKINLYIEPS